MADSAKEKTNNNYMNWYFKFEFIRCLWLSFARCDCMRKIILKSAFPETTLIPQSSWSASVLLLPFHKILCEEVFCGMVTLRTKEGLLCRHIPTPFPTGMQILPGDHGHILYTWRTEICISAHLLFLGLVSLQERNCYGFSDWKKFNPHFITFTHGS